MVLRQIASGLFATLLLFSACASPRRTQTQESPVPTDLAIVCGQGGGITGLWEGHSIGDGGNVLAWSGRGPGDNSRPAGKLTDEQTQALWNKISETRFFESKSDERGNMTAYLRITAHGRTHEAYWVPRPSQVSASPLQDLYTFCEETASRATTDH